MSDTLSDVEIERQDVELLPARTVLSLACHASSSTTSSSTTSTSPTAPSATSTTATPTPTAASTTGAPSSGGHTFTANNIFVFLATTQYNTVTGAAGGASGTGAAGASAATTGSAS